MIQFKIYLRHSDGIISESSTTDQKKALIIDKKYRKQAYNMNTEFGSDSKFYTIIKQISL